MRKRAVGLLKRWGSTRETIAWSFPYVPVFESVQPFQCVNKRTRHGERLSAQQKSHIQKHKEIKKQ